MKKINILLFFLLMAFPFSAYAILSMELTRGVTGAIPIAVVPFALPGDKPPHDVPQIVANDLQNSGRFKVFGREAVKVFPSDVRDVSADYFRRLGTNNVVVGKIQSLSNNTFEVSFQLIDLYRNSGKAGVLLSKKFVAPTNELRAVAHRISDLIYQQITGVRGVFSTKIAYVVVQQSENGVKRYILEVSDQDGYNPRPLLNSPEPIMSPAWSPSGKQIAYVSFEKRHAGIYLQDIVTGSRHLLSEFPGINGAPAWSPDGKKLALVLSKSGAPNIYIIDIATRALKQVTRDFYINTEPAWSADGKSILYTSNRSGGPQIYQLSLADGTTTRLTYDGDYNARASFARDRKHIAMIHRVSGFYNIGLLNLDAGTIRVLNNTVGDSASPSMAPNGSMILYDTFYRGRNVLAMVSSDGRVQLFLPARDGAAQDPAWSPFLS